MVMVGTDLALGLADLALVVLVVTDLADPADLALVVLVVTDLADLVDLVDLALGLEGMGHTDLALGLAGRRLEVVLVDHMGLVLGLEGLVLVVLVPAGRTVTWA